MMIGGDEDADNGGGNIDDDDPRTRDLGGDVVGDFTGLSVDDDPSSMRASELPTDPFVRMILPLESRAWPLRLPQPSVLPASPTRFDRGRF